MRQDQRRAWNREYRLRGRLWRGELKEKEIFLDNLVPGVTLDDGCGNGKGTPKIENLVGLDFSKFALSLYQAESKVLGDIVNLPFKANTFSNVLLIHSLDHLRNEERTEALLEAVRVLRDDGKIFVRVFSKSDFRYGKGKEVEGGTFQRGNGIETHYFGLKEFLNNPKYEVKRVINVDYHINIQMKKFKRSEFIIILSKSKSKNNQ